jgi:hypothetical protein
VKIARLNVNQNLNAQKPIANPNLMLNFWSTHAIAATAICSATCRGPI